MFVGYIKFSVFVGFFVNFGRGGVFYYVEFDGVSVEGLLEILDGWLYQFILQIGIILVNDDYVVVTIR